jgi:two-component system, OmpR family, sensor kinase
VPARAGDDRAPLLWAGSAYHVCVPRGLRVALSLCAAFVLDLVLYGTPVAAAYAVPILLAARWLPPRPVWLSGAASGAVYTLGATLQGFASATWAVYAALLTALTYLAAALASERAGASARAVEAEAARDALAVAVRAREDFLSVAAHELKTPLTSLRGMAQLALRRFRRDGGLAPERLEGALRTMDAQSAKLSRLVEQLLDVSRIERGRLALVREEVDLVRLVRDTAQHAQDLTARHTIRVEVPPEPVVAPADALRLEQVLTNLLDNAVKYSPDGGDVEVILARSGYGWLEIAVRDHGVGIVPEERERVFERFYQVDRLAHAPGLGIGLHVAREIVALHGGRIEIQTPPDGVGARIALTLPSGEVASPAPGADEPD